MSIYISEQTSTEMREALFPGNNNMTLAGHAVRFVAEQANKKEHVDILTLQNFIQFLKDRKYN
jgi:hypothetical protein